MNSGAPVRLVRDLWAGGRSRHHDLHLERLDERLGSRPEAVSLEQRLLLDRLQVQILSERVDELLVGHSRRDHRIATPAGPCRVELSSSEIALDGGCEE